MNQKEVWNKVALQWNIFRRKPIKEVVDFLEDKKGRILDLACGSGRHILKKEGLEFYGVDFSEEMIKLAKENFEDSEFAVSELDKLPFENEFFDAGIFIDSLHCLNSEEKRKKSLEELKRVLKLSAEVFITVWSKTHPSVLNHPKESTIAWRRGTEELARYYYFYDKEELENLLKEIGFEILMIEDDGKKIYVRARKIL